MTFPVEQSAANTTQTSNATSWGSQNMPSGIVAGDTLIAMAAVDGNSPGSAITFAGGWTLLLDGTSQGSVGVYLAIGYKKAVGSDTLTVTVPTSQQGSVRVIRIDAAEDPDTQPPELGFGSFSTSATPPVGANTPTGGAKDYKFYSVCAHDRNRTFTSAPTNYQTNDATLVSGGANGAQLSWGDRDLNASTEDPDNFTYTATDGFSSQIIAIHPAAAGGDITLTADPGSLTVTGAAAALAIGLASAAGSLLFSGATADLTQQTRLTADPGSLVLSGADAGLSQSLVSTPGSLVFSGAEATLSVTRLLTADPGSLVLTGADADLGFSVVLTADPGSLVLSGADADLGFSVVLTAGPGSLVLSGADADLGFSVVLGADPGSLVLTGAEADLIADADFVLVGDPGSLVLSGATADLAQQTRLTADPGSLVLRGADADLGFSVVLGSDPGSLVLSGADADLVADADFVLVGDPGSLVLSGATADLVESGAPPLVTRRGGRFLFDLEPELQDKIEEIRELVTVRPEPARPVSQKRPGATQSLLGIKGRVSIPPKKKARVNRLLAEAGLTMEEFLIIIS